MPPKTPAAVNHQFADYCCDLLSSQGLCTPKRMFGGWVISIDGMTLAIIAKAGGNERLWLKADDEVRAQWEALGCERISMEAKGKVMSMGYYSAPEEAMDSQDAMRPWAHLALECALRARSAKPKVTRKPAGSNKLGVAPAKAPAKRVPANKPAVKAKRKSPQA